MLSKSEKLIYAMGRLGSSALLSLIDLATFWFYLDFLNLGGLLTGIAVATGKLVIAFAGWYFGYLSDITRSERWGRRRQYILVGSLLLSFSTIMIFLPTYFISVTNRVQLFSYAVFFISLANLSYGLLSTPYVAWLAEIAEPEERVEASAYQNIFAMLAQIVGVVFSFSLPMILKGSIPLMLLFLIGVGLLEIILYVPALIKIREKEKLVPKPSVRREVRILLGNKNYRAWLALQGLMSIPTAILASLIMSYLQHVLTLEAFETYLVGGLMLITSMLLFFVWIKVSRRAGKKKPLVISVLIMAVSLSLTFFIGQPALDFVPFVFQAVLFIILVATGISGWYLLPNPITADIAHEDEITGGEARAGSYVGLVSIPLNILQAIARYVSGFLADLPMVEGKNYSMGMLLWGPVSSIMLLPCIIVLVKYIEADPLRKGLQK